MPGRKEKKKMKAKVNYYFEDDIFSGMPLNRDYDSSIQIGGFIFDLDHKGRIVGVEILNASKVFGIPRIFLNNMEGGRIIIEVDEKFIKLSISVKTLVRNSHKNSVLNVERARPDFIRPSEMSLAIA